ncbi:glycerol-3-phosphate dehydrogenase/oxidase [Arthrobacter sp. efr-133-TYG-118]|uniref:glycerol-3-phosphate dehydrogenase/oxidase n=1 Tax=Arthrobacter sp. efr-133-TYG-118 TaxID=3040279 RepID=UPI00255199EF|nr:glycerol-3-phosphate dehydrogenase/oxidase [Arthrobacter sp. efr-133-TYG-118]
MGYTSNSGSAAGAPRRTPVSALRERPHAQVLIIGGGINGVGTFRDLALQGVDVALVERGDYCQGASGASSHMIHGGIRYLENGEFRLVQESVVERNRLLKIAPHYVKPLQTTIPIFSTFSGILSAPTRFLTHKQGKPKERGAFLIKLGLSMYDFFSRDGGSVPRHQFRGKARALAELPRLHPGIKYAATYFDASVHNPERLTLDVLQDGEKAGIGSGLPGGSARASNYVSLLSTDPAAESAGPAGAVLLRDELTGEEFSFQADVIVNTTGAWVDLTNAAMGAESRFMGGTKGSHIVLDHPELLAACGGREIFFEHTDGRIVLIYPMGDRVLVGTTDVEADMAQDAVCTEGEIDYFFDLVGHVFPSIKVERSHIVYSFAGVRPLPRHDDTQPGFVSRDYRIERSERKASGVSAAQGGKAAVVLSLIGGKWTTFRALAEHLSNDVLRELGMERKTSTAKLAIGGGLGFPDSEDGIQDWVKMHMAPGLSADRVTGLLTRYGTRAEDVIAYLEAGEDRKLRSTNELSVRELEFMAVNEQLGHLVDVLIRRTSLAFRGLVTGELLNEIAEVLAAQLGWDATRHEAEIQHAQEVLLRFHGVTVHSLVA